MAAKDYISNETSEYLPVARSTNGTPLFACTCPDCGCVRIQDRRKIGKPCLPCSNKRRSTHKKSGTRIYRIWAGMRSRCIYKSATNYSYYGGRGIKVCKEWRDSPDEFFRWAEANGYSDDMDIDRINVNGDYEPSNCRFISHEVNSQLRRNARCTIEQASKVKDLLSAGLSTRETASLADVPYMTVWHIKSGNTWRNA